MTDHNSPQHPDHTRSVKKALEIHANRGLAHADPELAHEFAPVLNAIHDEVDRLEDLVMEALKDRGLIDYSDPDDAQDALMEIRKKAKSGDGIASKLLWLAHMWNIMLMVHEVVCVPAKAARLALVDNPDTDAHEALAALKQMMQNGAVEFTTEVDGQEPLDFDPRAN